ncbi:MAG: polysaccharide biosynthesis/export family protein [Parabacteroides sp.]
MKLKLVSVVALFVWLLSACSVPKDVAYFQGIDSATAEQIEQMSQTYTARICTDDMLTITVTAWDPTVVTPFNPPAFSYGQQAEVETATNTQLQTYLVDTDGNINFPVLGKIHAEGLTKQQLRDLLQEKIRIYVADAMVNVQIINYKVTILGEVARPGRLTVPNERLSILDALGSVGDLSINANRKNILVVRDNHGKKEFARLDITQPDIFTSPYFYLQQNDLVYVEPNNAKKRNSRYSAAQQYSVTVFSSVLSAISVITTVILAITK